MSQVSTHLLATQLALQCKLLLCRISEHLRTLPASLLQSQTYTRLQHFHTHDTQAISQNLTNAKHNHPQALRRLSNSRSRIVYLLALTSHLANADPHAEIHLLHMRISAFLPNFLQSQLLQRTFREFRLAAIFVENSMQGATSRRLLQPAEVEHLMPAFHVAFPVEVDMLSCSICLGAFKVRQRARRFLRCGHAYHAECIDVWLVECAPSCPLCRNCVRPPAVFPGLPEENEENECELEDGS